MTQFVFKLPDLGEGTVEAEIVSWRVKPGDAVSEDDALAEVMTDKAVVELPAPVSGRIVSLACAPGDRVAVGAELVVFAVGDADTRDVERTHSPQTSAIDVASRSNKPISADTHVQTARVLTSPSIRRRARELGVDLTGIVGSGPQGRILREDFEAAIKRSAALSSNKDLQQPQKVCEDREAVEEIKVIGLRRLIAQRMLEAKRNIPHFSYVEEVDITELEALRQHLNATHAAGALTYLPFLVMALTRVLQTFPQCNARYDAERRVLLRHRAVHVGIATQTEEGLKVPVLRNAQDRTLWNMADEIRRLSDAARSNRATRQELSGSTITVTSLGKLGGIVSTPIINAPELAIIGVNRAVERPVVHSGVIVIRRMMNLSSSFDHRFIDGHDAAALVQALKQSLEHPAAIFIS